MLPLVSEIRAGPDNCLRNHAPSPVAVGDPTPGQIIWSDLDLHVVPRQDPDPVHTHLAGAVRKYLVPILELHSKHRVWKRLDHRSLENDRLLLRLEIFGLGQNLPP